MVIISNDSMREARWLYGEMMVSLRLAVEDAVVGFNAMDHFGTAVHYRKDLGKIADEYGISYDDLLKQVI